MMDLKVIARNNITKENQVLRQILGICSALAVTNLMSNSLVMGLGVALLLGFQVLPFHYLISGYPSVFAC